MRLSEAIRAGAKLGPQAFGRMSSEDTGTCALGAAFVHIGAIRSGAYVRSVATEILFSVFPVTARRIPFAACPRELQKELWDFALMGKGVTAPVGQLITVLNDRLRWSREAIAEWVETIERKYEAEETDIAPLPVTREPAEPSLVG